MAPAILAAKGVTKPALMVGRPVHDRCCELAIRVEVVEGRDAAGALGGSGVARSGG